MTKKRDAMTRKSDAMTTFRDAMTILSRRYDDVLYLLEYECSNILQLKTGRFAIAELLSTGCQQMSSIRCHDAR